MHRRWRSPDRHRTPREDVRAFVFLRARLDQQIPSLEDSPRYTPSTTFETFAFRWPPGREPADDPRVAATGTAARELVEKRDRWLNPEGADAATLKQRTLTNLYNQRPTWLDLAHTKLDAAVLDAYGWPHDLADEAILARLLALNLARAAGQGGAVSASVDTEDGAATHNE